MTNLLEIFDHLDDDKSTQINDRILIIDGLNTFLRIFSSVPVISDKGEHVGGIIGTIRSIGSNIRDFNPSRVIVVFDGKGGSARRRKLFPEYKENRTGKYKLRREFFSSEEEERKSCRLQLMRVMQYMELFPIQTICMDNIEADDVIAYMTMQYFNDKAKKIRIVSTDRDFLQLVSDQVEVYSPVKKKLYDLNTLEEEMGIHPKNYLLYRTIDGDISDNINGVNGIGLKTLTKYFPEITEKILDTQYLIDESIKRVEEYKKKAPKIYENIVNSQEIMTRNYALMQLQDTDISGHSKMMIMDILRQIPTKTDRMTLKKYLIDDYLHTSFKDLNGWLYSTFNTLDIWAK